MTDAGCSRLLRSVRGSSKSLAQSGVAHCLCLDSHAAAFSAVAAKPQAFALALDQLQLLPYNCCAALHVASMSAVLFVCLALQHCACLLQAVSRGLAAASA